MSKVVFGKEVFTTLEELVAPKHTALLIADAQNDFCCPGGCLDQLPNSDMKLMRPFIENTKAFFISGKAGNPLSREEHMERFQDCIHYANKPLPGVNIEKILPMVNQVEEAKDVCNLIPLLLVG